ncbi:MAG: ubiquinone biosynthesis accessory factor UbiJ, partial [Gallionella sp.]
NHLLAQNSWAQAKLAKFAAQTVRFNLAPFSFAYLILSDGTLQATDSNACSDAELTLAPTLLPRLLAKDEAAYAQIVRAGDAALLSEIFYLWRNLHWDAAQDLSVFTGDIAAERVVQTVQNSHAQAKAAALNFSQAAAEYWTEERPLLAKPNHIKAFVAGVDTLRDDLARLAARLHRLTTPK